MNFYKRHLGDYAKDTAHLTMIEHGAYGLLLDRYYSTEQPINADQAYRLARARTEEEKAAVDAVLDEYFILVDGAWVNGRCEEEIIKASGEIEAAKQNGRKGGRPRKQTQEKPNGLSLGIPTETQDVTQTKAHQTPDTINQEDKKTTRKSAPPSARIFVSESEMVDAGVSQTVATEYQGYRRAKRAPLTPSAWRRIASEARKTDLGIDACLTLAMSRGWQGFEAAWVDELREIKQGYATWARELNRSAA